MKEEVDQATTTYNKDIAKLKRENDSIKRRFMETTAETGDHVLRIESY